MTLRSFGRSDRSGRRQSRRVKEILEENIANVYAKLNYAFNSAKDGPDALLSMPDDELVAFPSVLPLKHKVEFEEEDEENLTKFNS